MTVFLFSLAGIPPLGGWWAKFRVMEAVIDAECIGVVLGVFVAVNSVIALYYYARIGLGMWAEDAPTATRHRSVSRRRWCRRWPSRSHSPSPSAFTRHW